jgi:hypothetical protein
VFFNTIGSNLTFASPQHCCELTGFTSARVAWKCVQTVWPSAFQLCQSRRVSG